MACLKFVLVALPLLYLTEASVPYKIGYFEQKIDHFNFIEASTYMQRYLYTGEPCRSYAEASELVNSVTLGARGVFFSKVGENAQ